MRRNSGSDTPPRATAPAQGAPTAPTVPAATRARAPGWRDPRLWVGVAIVAASIAVGARVLSAADETVQVWAVAHDVSAGLQVGEDDLEATRVHFADDTELARYLRADSGLPPDRTLLHDVARGELLPRAALGADRGTDLAQVPLEVSPGQVPPSVRPGAVVDVYLLGTARHAEEPVLAGVTVVAVPRAEDTFAPTGLQQVVVSVPADQVAGFYRRLGALDDAVLSVVRSHA